MKFRSCDCKKVETPTGDDPFAWIDEWWEMPEGSFFWREQTQTGYEGFYRTLWIVFPYETKGVWPGHCLPVYLQGESKLAIESASWEWDGNEDLPTLSPSIACGPPKHRDWHGYLKAGKLEACE